MKHIRRRRSVGSATTPRSHTGSPWQPWHARVVVPTTLHANSRHFRKVLGDLPSRPPPSLRCLSTIPRCFRESHPCIIEPTCLRVLRKSDFTAVPTHGRLSSSCVSLASLQQYSYTFEDTLVRRCHGSVPRYTSFTRRAVGCTSRASATSLLEDTRRRFRRRVGVATDGYRDRRIDK